MLLFDFSMQKNLAFFPDGSRTQGGGPDRMAVEWLSSLGGDILSSRRSRRFCDQS